MSRDASEESCRRIREDADGERQFILHPENDEVFTRTGRQVIESCRLGISIEVWLAERDTMFDHVRRWMQESGMGHRIRMCFAAPRGIGIGLFFVPESDSFDFDLADELAELNGQLVRSFNIGPVEMHQIPEQELGRFVPPGAALRIDGHADESHRSVAP
jgi:hypothetical protein